MRDACGHAGPGEHRLLETRRARRRERVSAKGTDRDAAHRRVAVTLPVQGRAAARAEVPADQIAAIGAALEHLAVALEPHLLFLEGGAVMEGRAGAALAGIAVADIN